MNDLTASEAAVAGGIIGGMIGVISIIAIVYYVFIIIACWKIFKKAGVAGWKSLIPIYNNYILYKIVGMKKWFWITIGVTCAASFIAGALGFDTTNIENNSMTGVNLFALILLCAASVFTIGISVMNYLRISRVFGHGVGFAIGLILFPGLFMLILGFGKSKYDKKLAKSWE